jgi:ABC-type multidrug transport system ATPase subunit
MTGISLTVSHVSKSFPGSSGPKHALQDVSFDVPAGQTVCLLGPNGSGKTTLLKVLSTLLSPDEGHVRLGPLDAHQNLGEAKRLLGFASSEDHSFYGRLSVERNLWFYAQLHGLSRPVWTDRLAVLNRQLDLAGFLAQPFRELSSGQKQRVLLARALLHDPVLLLLDEPHQNLDPRFAAQLRRLLAEDWGASGRKTIVISTHHLEDALKISDRWVVLSEGRVRFDGSLAAARAGRPDFSVEAFFQGLTAPSHAA